MGTKANNGNGNSGNDQCSCGLGTQLLRFAAGFCKHPGMVGWMFPSSRFLVNEVLKQIDWTNAREIVEYGPGVGAFTKQLLERMHPEGRLIALEINPEYVCYLRSSIHDPRFHLVERSATEIGSVLESLGSSGADYVISGIPFSMLPHNLRGAIVHNTHAVLKPEGKFLVYQFSNAVRPYLEQAFTRVSRDLELLNILPARLYYCAR